MSRFEISRFGSLSSVFSLRNIFSNNIEDDQSESQSTYHLINVFIEQQNKQKMQLLSLTNMEHGLSHLCINVPVSHF